MSGDVFSYHNPGRSCWHLVEAVEASKQPTVHRTAPPLTTKSDLVPNAMCQAQESPIYERLVGDGPHWASASSF